ncbi:hypothetical protein [Algibacter mikhailovii]|nr:hypothetical protein [Algibacter mikhailovii]
MQLAPNKTSIEATVTALSNNQEEISVVIIKLPPEKPLPAFLHQGKMVKAKNLSPTNNTIELQIGDIINAEIEVMGDPFTQTYLLHNISKAKDSL